jgi:hypothetical protein
MMVERKIESYLSIRERGKGIPYGDCQKENGSVNHGFKLLKGRLHDIATIPEANEDVALKQALSKLNEKNTGIFTIGCLSGPVRDQHGHRMTGYIEFAFNYVELVVDARNYFPIFFDFNKRLTQHGMIDDVRFDWELEGAHFFEADCDGFTCAITVNTRYCKSGEEARGLWDSAICILSTYLGEVPILPYTRIY